MFGTIRRHQTWLWAVIITLTIISFVYFFSPYTKMSNSARGPVDYGSINGERITADQISDARREIILRYFFLTGTWLDDQEAKRAQIDPEEQLYQWLLLVSEQKRLGIQVGSDEVVQAAREFVKQFQRQGITSPSMFVDRVLKPRGLEVDDFERYVRHYIGLQELRETVTIGGKLVTPEEAKSLYVHEHEELATEAVFFTATNYLPQVTVTPDALQRFYSNHLADYRIPERMQVSYVKFELTNYLGQAAQLMEKMTNLTEQVDAEYNRRGTNYYPDAKSPEEAKQRIRDDLRKELALREARTQANGFARELFDKEPVRLENLQALAGQKGLEVKVSAAFDAAEGPKDFGANPNVATVAFKLNPTNNPFSEPIVGEDGAYVLAYNRLIPSEIPAMDQVRERVESDYKRTEAVGLARKAGLDFYQSLTNLISQGQTFSAICTNAHFTPVEPPPFSISTRELPGLEGRVDVGLLKQTGFTCKVGTLSHFQITPEGGFILFVKAKLPVAEAKMQSELPAFTSALRQSRQNEAFQVWFNREAERGLRDTPASPSRRQPPAMSSRTRKT